MPADQVLATLLRALQHSYALEESSRLLSTAASLLTILTNPRNITLLTAQLLNAPAIWDRPDGLNTCLQVLQTFYSASASLLGQPQRHGRTTNGVSPAEWVKAVIKGLDQTAPRWRHLLPIAGMLLGLERQDASGHAVRRDLMDALVKAKNLVMEEEKEVEQMKEQAQGLSRHCIALVSTYTFDLLPDAHRRYINHDALLPILISTAFFTEEGFQSGYFLGAIDADVVQMGRDQFTWSVQSTSYLRLQRLSSRPLMSSMGPLSRLIGHCIDVVSDPGLVYTSVQALESFTRTLVTQWRQNKLSEIDVSDELAFLHRDALETTIPSLWKVLKTAMFASINILRSVISRTIGDSSLAADNYAPFLATTTLHTLRHLFFISSRLGPNSFSNNVFVFLSAIDILSHYPEHAHAFLTEIRPKRESSDIATTTNTTTTNILPDRHPLDRCMDHFFLNTAEHLAPVLSPGTNEDLLVTAAMPYLDVEDAMQQPQSVRVIFEAAHTVMLAVLAAPQNALELTPRILSFYVDVLLKAFPQSLTPRQFRLAFKTLVRLVSPPSPLAVAQPDLAMTLLEVVRHRALEEVKTTVDSGGKADEPPRSPPASIDDHNHAASPQNTNQTSSPETVTALVLSVIDALPFLFPPDILEDWLVLTAELIHAAFDDNGGGGDGGDQTMVSAREVCRARLWEVMSDGEMDVERAEICVGWWGTRGGREMVLGL